MTIGTVLGKGAHLLPVDGESADQLIILEHRYVDRRPRTAERDRRGEDSVGGVVGSVAHLLCPHDVIEVTARRRSKRSALHEFDKCRRRTEVRGAAKRLAIEAHQHPEFGLANSCGILQQALENGLQVAGRTRDHLEHVGGGGLLLKRLAECARAGLHLVEETNIFDGNHCLIGKRGEQLDLLITERLYDRTRHREHADWGALPQKRDPEHGAEAAAFLRFLPDVLGVGKHIRDMNDASFQRGSANESSTAGPDRLAFHVFLVFR